MNFIIRELMEKGLDLTEEKRLDCYCCCFHRGMVVKNQNGGLVLYKLLKGRVVRDR